MHVLTGDHEQTAAANNLVESSILEQSERVHYIKSFILYIKLSASSTKLAHPTILIICAGAKFLL